MSLIRNPWFDRVVMTLILLNCVFLAMDSRELVFEETTRGCVTRPPQRPTPTDALVLSSTWTRFNTRFVVNRPFSRLNPSPRPESHRKAVDNSENIFLSLFCGEMVIKIVAMGLTSCTRTLHSETSWNRLDFTVVILGIIAAMNLGNFSAIRTVRVLRPLRTLQGFAGMRQLVVTLLNSLPLLGDAACSWRFCSFCWGRWGCSSSAGR